MNIEVIMAGLPGNPSGKRGGARPNSGPKPGSPRVHVKELREAIEKKVGMAYQDILAETYSKLFNHFQNDMFVREYLTFNENMNRRILEEQKQQVELTGLEELSKEEVKQRIDNLLTRKALSEAQAATAAATVAQDSPEKA